MTVFIKIKMLTACLIIYVIISDSVFEKHTFVSSIYFCILVENKLLENKHISTVEYITCIIGKSYKWFYVSLFVIFIQFAHKNSSLRITLLQLYDILKINHIARNYI